MSNAADGCVLVIFGASGDLTRRKLLPAIYNLIESNHLPDRFAILGVARPAADEASYRAAMRERVADAEGEALEAGTWQRIEDRLYYLSGEFNDPGLYETKQEPNTGYETLLFDAMTGDQTLFHRMDIVEAGWQVVDPILRAWQADARSPVPVNAPGSSGPAEADGLIERDGRTRRG